MKLEDGGGSAVEGDSEGEAYNVGTIVRAFFAMLIAMARTWAQMD